MDLLAQEERRKYEKVWRTAKDYGSWSPGMDSVTEAHEFFQYAKGTVRRPDALIDFGCGDCQALNKFWNLGYQPCYGVDIAAVTPQVIQAVLWNLPPDLPMADFGFCADVMEHIPTEKVRDVLLNIRDKAEVVYFRISTVPDLMGATIGEKLHLTVAPAAWWHGCISAVFGEGRVGLIRKEQSYCIIGVRR